MRVKMRPPTLPWIGFNLFRLVAVIFLSWAYVVQFLALASDMSAYSSTLSLPTANTTFSDSWGSSPTPSASVLSTADSITATAVTAIANNPAVADSLPTSTSTPITSSIDVPTGLIAASTSSANLGSSFSGIKVAAEVSSTAFAAATMVGSGNKVAGVARVQEQRQKTRRRRRQVKRDEEDEADWGMSSLPRQPGGIAFAIISRIVIALVLALLTMGQIGLPEQFLYRWIGWLGPQSTPIWLGLPQTIVSVENLRVYAKPAYLVPAWGLLAIGSINIILGGTLLWLGRNLPDSPPAPLYFNLSQRLLYFTPPPPLYAQLLQKSSDVDVEQNAGEREDVERRRRLPSNALEFGLDDEFEYEEDEEEEKESAMSHTDTHEAGRKQLPIRKPPITTDPFNPAAQLDLLPPKVQTMAKPRNHLDISQGGYPTFSRSGTDGMIDPSRQVPTGIIERTKDGRVIKFISEDGREVARPGIVTEDADSKARQMGMGHQQRSEAKDVRSSPARKAPPVISPKTAASTETASIPAQVEQLRAQSQIRPTSRSRSRAHDSLAIPGKHHTSSDRRAEILSHQSIPRRSDSTGSTTDDQVAKSRQRERQSSQSGYEAAYDLGPKFPLPPARQGSGNDHQVSHLNVKVEGVKMDRGPLSPREPRKVRTEGDFAKVDRITEKDLKDASVSKSTSKSIRTHTTEEPTNTTVNPKAQRQRSALAGSRSRAGDTSASASDSETSIVNSTDETTTRTQTQTKASRGVRFDLSPLPESATIPIPDPHESEKEEEEEDFHPTIKSPGLRIPGTNFHLPLPSLTPTQKAKDAGISSDSESESQSEEDEHQQVTRTRPLTKQARKPSNQLDASTTQTKSARDRAEAHVRRVQSRCTSMTTTKTKDRPKTILGAVLGGGYLDGGDEVSLEPRGGKRRPSSVSIG